MTDSFELNPNELKEIAGGGGSVYEYTGEAHFYSDTGVRQNVSTVFGEKSDSPRTAKENILSTIQTGFVQFPGSTYAMYRIRRYNTVTPGYTYSDYTRVNK